MSAPPPPRPRVRTPTPQNVAAAQAAYYLPTALAPLISRRRFEAVTGPKLDWWLVITVSSLVGVIGGVLGQAARRRDRAMAVELRLLGAGTACGLAAVDVVYVARRRISPVYLIDGGIQLGLLAGWAVAGRRGNHARTPEPPGPHRVPRA
jgi:hypothetical protein